MVGLPFDVEAPGVEEAVPEGVAPADVAMHLAFTKAQAVARRRPDDLVIGADTLVVIDGQILGKPADPGEAFRMLQQLSGRTHEVWTGVALVHHASGRQALAVECSRVTFRALREEQLRRYVETGEGMDKAGAYAVQGVGALLVRRIEGCYYNVVGLPLATVAELLEGFGVVLP